MSRTRGSSHRFHQDDGVVLGKGGVPLTPAGAPALDRQGNYVSPAAAALTAPRNIPGHVVLKGPGAEPVPMPGAITGYCASPQSWARDMDAWELAQMLNMLLPDGFVINVTADEHARMQGNLRRHFMAVRG
jgi:hypothetical protein